MLGLWWESSIDPEHQQTPRVRRRATLEEELLELQGSKLNAYNDL